jgi:hypothetical protein
MPIPRVRFTVRRLIVAVAVAIVVVAHLPDPLVLEPSPIWTTSVASADGMIVTTTYTFFLRQQIVLFRLEIGAVVAGLLIAAHAAAWLWRRWLRARSCPIILDEPLPQIRFTLRRMMAAVAVCATMLGIGCGLATRGARFRRLAIDHHARIREPWYHAQIIWTWEPPLHISPHDEWHLAMARKYGFAAQYPWLPVASDPPEPE